MFAMLGSMIANLFEYILIAYQNANQHLDVPSSCDGDFQEEKRDSPLEWLSPSLAWNSQLIGSTARYKFKKLLTFKSSGISHEF